MNATLILIAATAVTFFLMGSVWVAVLAMTVLSHHRDRMNRRLRDQQAEVVRLQRLADRGR
ncbi:hypothetical protein ACFVWN_08750 [Nocardiopsis flavescens]|uniref:LapA family protein n=1 Tax=Nocardiopsis flavescens TaxID=758803 RepID=A0A1M6H6M5_9ACTN|nr:hypothetical protein [Nocardiopsis flavescens]SHJ17773.1 hypothetical protein SAMN05421803_10453 [Nocardiopsis flavescens]